MKNASMFNEWQEILRRDYSQTFPIMFPIMFLVLVSKTSLSCLINRSGDGQRWSICEVRGICPLAETSRHLPYYVRRRPRIFYGVRHIIRTFHRSLVPSFLETVNSPRISPNGHFSFMQLNKLLF